jgi:hypothetical protein
MFAHEFLGFSQDLKFSSITKKNKIKSDGKLKVEIKLV